MCRERPLAKKLKLFQKPHVVFVEEADVVDAIAEHGDAFDAEAECPASPDGGIIADVLEHLRMHHAAAGDLQPVLAHLFHERGGEINLVARLGVAEIMRSETDLYVAAHEFAEDKFDRALEVADGDALVHVKPLDLVEGRVVRGVGVVTAIHAAGHDDAYGRRLFLHDADLDGRSMSPQKRGTSSLTPALSPNRGGNTPSVGCNIEGILGIACRMVGGRVERVEAMILVLNLRPVGHGETNLAERADDVVGDLRERMQFAERAAAA